MIWGYDDKGSEFYKLKVRDLETMTELDDLITDSNGGGMGRRKRGLFLYAAR